MLISLTVQDEIVIQPYVDVRVTDAQVNDEGSNSLSLDITPQYDVVLNSTTEEGEVSSQTLESGNVLAVEASEDDPIIVNIPLTEDFVGDSENAYVVHEHGNETYMYDASIDTNQVLTFSNPNGFSMFRVTFDPCKKDHHRIISRGNGITPTCTEAGRASNTVCKECGAVITVGKTIPAKGHTWGDWVIADASTKTHTCSVCGAKESQKIDAASVRYKTHVQSYGWQLWKSDGDTAGTSGLSKRPEAIQIVLVSKGGSAPGSTARAFIGNANDATSTTPGASVSYRTHVQTYGWQNWKVDGAMSGTSGEAKRLEAIEIRLVPKGGAAPGSTSRAFMKYKLGKISQKSQGQVSRLMESPSLSFFFLPFFPFPT